MPYKDLNSAAAIESRKRCGERSNERRKEWTRLNPRRKSVPMEEQRDSIKKYQSAWSKTDEGRRSILSAQLKHRHGKSLEDVEELVRVQGGLCLICNRPLDLENRLSANGPTIDHKHNNGCCEDGKSCDKCRRGVVHRSCNSGLGMFQDDPVLLRLAAEYLERFSDALQF